MNAQKRIAYLVGIHVVIATLSSIAWSAVDGGQHVWNSATFVVCSSIYVGQVQLLGIWLGLSSSPWRTKLFLALFGFVLFADLWPFSRYDTWSDAIENALPHAIVIASIAAAFAMCRLLVARIERRSHWPSVTTDQFTLRTLLCVTGLIGVLLAGAKVAGDLVQSEPSVGSGLAFAISAVMSSLIAAWVCLGFRSVWIRAPFLIVGSVASGLIETIGLTSQSFHVLSFLLSTGLFLSGAFITFVSMFVVRSCGYRLVPIRNSAVTTQITQELDAAGV